MKVQVLVTLEETVLGLLISTAQGAFNAGDLFAAMIVLTVVALGADYVMTTLEKRLLK